MKVAQITYSANPSSAVTRLSKSLNMQNIQSDILAIKSNNIEIKKIKPNIVNKVINHIIYISEKKILKILYPRKNQMYFDISNYGCITKKFIVALQDYDIIHIHWINGMLSYKDIKKISNINKPVLWTMHDCWAYTGGCHHGCNNFKELCGNCKILNSNNKNDISKYVLKKKIKNFSNNLIIISPSKWMDERVKTSTLFKNNKSYYIPNGIPTNIFKSYNNKHGLYRILVGADSPQKSPYKGYEYLVKTIKIIVEKYPNYSQKIELIFFGNNCDSEIIRKDLAGVKSIKFEGYINSQEKLAKLYSSANYFLCTSIYDNLPTTLIESLACYTPCISFDTGGINDIIDHKFNGYLAERLNCEDLAKGIIWCINNNNKNILGENGRAKVMSCFSDYLMAKRHSELYKELR